MYMTSLQQCLHLLDGSAVPPSAVNFVAGGAARAFAGTVMYPVSVVKTRMEWANSPASPFRNLRHALTSIAATEGPRALYRGLPATLVRDVPYAGLYYATYARLNAGLQPYDNVPTLVRFFAASWFAAVFATVVTHPADVVRTRQQLASSKVSVFQEVQSIARHEPLSTFFRGVMPRLVRRGFATGITWTLFECLSRLNE